MIGRRLPLLLLTLGIAGWLVACDAGGPKPPDGFDVWDTAFEIRSDGTWIYDGRVLRESGESWKEPHILATLKEIWINVDLALYRLGSGTGPDCCSEWLIVRVDGDTPFAEVDSFFGMCEDEPFFFPHLAFDLRHLEEAGGDWCYVTLPMNFGTVCYPETRSRFPAWIVEAEPVDSAGATSDGTHRPYVFEVVGGRTRIERHTPREIVEYPKMILQHPAQLCCHPEVPWRVLAPALVEYRKLDVPRQRPDLLTRARHAELIREIAEDQ